MPGNSRRTQTGTRLSREDWIDGALAMCGELGFDRVAAEPLAVRLGVTKGSFYWHFANREDLLAALLDRWEQTRTRTVIEQLDALRATPAADRLGRLVRNSFERTLTDPTEWAILAAAAHPSVAPVVGRVHAARVGYLSDLFVLTGLSLSRAQARALVLYAAYLGHQMLLAQSAGQTGGAHGEPRLDEAAAACYLDELIALTAAP